MRDTLFRLEQTIAQRASASAGQSYVAALLAKGKGKIAQKVGEEATETIIAALEGSPQELTGEAADLLFHLLLLLRAGGVSLDEVLDELDRRDGVSGLVEKASRTQTQE